MRNIISNWCIRGPCARAGKVTVVVVAGSVF
jgi:hypothetical protein